MKNLKYLVSIHFFSHIVAFFFLNDSAAFAQSSAFNIPEETKQFDFWIGEWNAKWTNQNGSEGIGSNRIEYILGGGIVSENFDGSPGMNLIGKSWSIYNPGKKHWQQTWADNNGGYIVFTGEFKEGKMVLITAFTTNANGQKSANRMVFHSIKKDSFVWDWENTTDGGATWNVTWKINYTRKK